MGVKEILINKRFIVNVFIAVAVLFGVNNGHADVDKRKTYDYLLIEQTYKRELHIPFIYNSNHFKTYKSNIFGVTILKLYIDGELIKPQKFLGLIDDIDNSVVTIDGAKYVYLVGTNEYDNNDKYWTLIFNNGHSGEVDLLEYFIPRKVSDVIVDYCINVPGEQCGKSQTLQIKVEE